MHCSTSIIIRIQQVRFNVSRHESKYYQKRRIIFEHIQTLPQDGNTLAKFSSACSACSTFVTDPATSTQVTKQDKSRPRWRCRLHLLEEAHQAYTSSSFSCGLLGTHRQADRQKESCTVSLYSIDSSTDFSNWRPTALGDTLYKVWTGIVIQCLARHAEHFDRLSST